MTFKTSLKTRFQVVKHGTLNYRVVISFALLEVHNIWCCSCSRPGTQRCFQDIILLCSNEDNHQVTDPVRVISTIIFQLCFLKERIKIQRNNSTSHLFTNKHRQAKYYQVLYDSRSTFRSPCSEAISAYARFVKFNPSILHVQNWLAPVVFE